MDKVAFYKEQIYKVAALSNEAMTTARHAFHQLSELKNPDLLYHKAGTSREALEFARELSKNMTEKHRLKFYKLEGTGREKSVPGKADMTNDLTEGFTNLYKNRPKSLGHLAAGMRDIVGSSGKMNYYNPVTHSIRTRITNPAITSHEIGHASVVRKPGLEYSILTIMKAKPTEAMGRTLGSGHIGIKHGKIFQKYIDDGFMDGNAKSKEIGGHLKKLWREARISGNQGLLNELYANAYSYHAMSKKFGKKFADDNLHVGLMSNLSYANHAAAHEPLLHPSAKKFVDAVMDSPVKIKGGKAKPFRQVMKEREEAYSKWEPGRGNPPPKESDFGPHKELTESRMESSNREKYKKTIAGNPWARKEAPANDNEEEAKFFSKRIKINAVKTVAGAAGATAGIIGIKKLHDKKFGK